MNVTNVQQQQQLKVTHWWKNGVRVHSKQQSHGGLSWSLSVTACAGLCLFDPLVVNDWWHCRAASLWIVHVAWMRSSDLSSSLCLPEEAAQSRSLLYIHCGTDESFTWLMHSVLWCSAFSVPPPAPFSLGCLSGGRVWPSLWKPDQGKLLSRKCKTLQPSKHVYNGPYPLIKFFFFALNNMFFSRPRFQETLSLLLHPSPLHPFHSFSFDHLLHQI